MPPGNVDTIKSSVVDMQRFEIVKTGTAKWPALSVPNPGAGTWGNGQAITTIAHDLNYIPVILAYCQIVTLNKTYPVPLTIYNAPATNNAGWGNLEAWADVNNFYLASEITAFGGAYAFTANDFQCQYYLMKTKSKRVR